MEVRIPLHGVIAGRTGSKSGSILIGFSAMIISQVSLKV